MQLDSSIFREYDIRGIFDQNLTEEVVRQLGLHLGALMAKESDSVAVGYDARTHSPILFEWLKSGLENFIKVYDLGLIPTPIAYFATFHPIQDTHLKNSIMITGSHNPPNYNGFKITINQKPFYGQQIQELQEQMRKNPLAFKPHSSKTHTLPAKETYQTYLIDAFTSLKNFPYKIALDFGNGVGALGLIPVLQALDICFDSLYAKPDGTFPNHHPDPSEAKNLEDLKQHMQVQNISIGFAFDGDGDRIALLTPNHIYTGDELAILFAQSLAKEGIKPIVIGEVKCSQVMYDTINALGQAIMYKTGHSNLKVKLKEINAHFAAEMSGHLFFNDRYFGYDDALYACLRLLELFVRTTPTELEEIINALPYSYKTPEEKISVKEEEKFNIIEKLKSALKGKLDPDFPPIVEIIEIDGVRVVFEHGFALVRASNTTPTLVTRFEGKDKECAQNYKRAVLNLLEKQKG
ncbi:phosphomannomutase/phosphoglucomutase [Helicobacter suis]|uniref:phosphomannomutase/phosphoglucomutase n=1 Tax=Helicobacter suis TaxID=104628 RepID=UPI0001F7A57D|nr:phosphomannomutase/phosphoglucomutase [Helicobacter suis]EFX43352.1 phosphomannomutase [Helicobacter suis HS1]BDR28917.1 phosphomannomutase [Helicobacter suis HS1]